MVWKIVNNNVLDKNMVYIFSYRDNLTTIAVKFNRTLEDFVYEM